MHMLPRTRLERQLEVRALDHYQECFMVVAALILWRASAIGLGIYCSTYRLVVRFL